MAQTLNGQPMNDATINLTADDLNPGGVNNAPSPARIPPGDIDISQDVEQGPTAPTPGKKDTSQAIGNPKKINLPPPIVSPTPTVPMFAPDGTPGDIPSEKVHEAIANGGSIGVPVLAPDGTHGIVPAGRLHDALKAGGKIDSSGWTPDQLNAHPTIGQRLEKTITGPGMVIDPDALKNSRNVELSKMSPIAATQEIHQAASIPLVRPEQAMTPEEQQNNPTLHAGLEFAGGLSSPENLAIMVGSGGLGRLPGPAGPLIAKALSAGFSLQVIAQTAQESPKFMEALARGDENEAKYELTKMVLGLGMAEQGAEHVGTNEATGEKAFNPNLGTAVGTSADALVHAAGEYGGKAIDAAKNISGAGLAKTAGRMVAGAFAQPINAMTEGPEAKITRAAGGSAGVQERDFQQNIPRAMKYIVEENKTNPIKTPEDMAEAAYNQKNKLGQQLYKSRPGETIDGNRVADQITSGINKSTAQHFPEVADAITKWADTFRGPYNLDDAMAAITDFNSKLRQFYKQSPSDQFRMAQADPKLGMLQDAADALRDVAFDKLEKLGEKNIPELRKDYGALNQLQRIFEKRAVVYGRQAPIDFKSSLGAIAAVASGHPLAAAVPYLTKYLNSPEYLLQSGIEKASKAAEAGKPSNPQIEQSRTPVKEIRPPGVKPYQEPATPGGQAAPAETLKPGTAGTPTEAGKPVKTAPVKASANPTAATEAPAPDSGIDLETGKQPKITVPKKNKGPESEVFNNGGWFLPDGQNYVHHGNETHGVSALNMGYTGSEPYNPNPTPLSARVDALRKGAIRATLDGKDGVTTLELFGITEKSKPRLLDALSYAPTDKPVYIAYGEGKPNLPPKEFNNPEEATDWVDRQTPQSPGMDLETGAAPIEGVRSDFKPYTPENPEGYEKPMPIPAENMPKGMFQRDAHIHEWGHVANAAIEGFGTEGIKSHLNETLPVGNRTAAAARITFGDTGIKIKDGKIDPATLRENFGKMLATTMGGAAANELHSGIPFERNEGLHSDLRVIRDMGKSLGFTPDETESAIRYALDRAKRNLTIPGVGDMLTQNAGVRESGLSATMHASPERTEAFAAEMRRLRDDHYQQQKSGATGSPTELHDTRTAGDDASVRQGADTGREEGDEGSRPAGDLETGRKVDKVSERLSKKYDLTKDVEPGDKTARFILGDGNVVRDPDENETRHYGVAAAGLGRSFNYEDADEMTEKGEKLVEQFMNKTGSVRVQPEFSDAVGFHVNGRPSDGQLRSMAKLAKGLSVIYDLPGKSGEGSFGDFQRELDKVYPKGKDLETGRGLKERTTGDENHDEVIRSAGAVPAGVMFPGTDYAIKMFHDPETGSTLGFKPSEAVTPETVRQKLAESREQFGVKTGVAPEKEAFRGSHYSSVPAEEGQIRGESRGKSKAGSEGARLEYENRVPGVYAYREGARPEPQIATRANKYDIEGDKAIADIGGREKKLFEDAHASAVEKYKSAGDNDTVASQKALNDAEAALKNAGFDGYEDKNSKTGSVFLFGDQPVKESLPPMLRGRQFSQIGPEEYHEALSKNPHSASLSEVNPDAEIYQMHEHGKPVSVFYAINPDGEISGVVNNSNGEVKNAAKDVFKDAQERGGKYLTAWNVNEKLPDLYRKQGFETVGESPYDEASYGPPSDELKTSWRTSGWKEGDPYPSVVRMEPKGAKTGIDLETGAGESKAATNIPYYDVLAHIKKLHGEDFEDYDRVSSHKLWEKKSVPISVLTTDAQIHKPTVQEYAKQKPETSPAIVVDEQNDVIDGQHRVAAAKLRGETTIEAYVPKRIDKIDLETGAAVAEPEEETGDTSFNFGANAAEPGDKATARAQKRIADWKQSPAFHSSTGGTPEAPAAPPAPAGHEDLPTVSTRTPGITANKEPIDDHSNRLLTSDMQAASAAPGFLKKLADRVSDIPGFKDPGGEDHEARTNAFIRHVADNTKFVQSKVTPEEFATDSQWYPVGAHERGIEVAKAHGLEPHQAYAVTAALSPLTDWDQNTAQAERAAEIWKNQQDTKFTPEMKKAAKEILTVPEMQHFKPIFKSLEGKTLGELPTLAEQAWWLRLYEEGHYDRSFQTWNPDGTPAGLAKNADGTPKSLSWSFQSLIENAINIMKDGSQENISRTLGDGHKVRNFYNNQLSPDDPRFLTIDTHQVNIGQLRPMSGSYPDVADNFGSPQNAPYGLSGTYPMYDAGTRLAAKELGIDIPSRLQSSGWVKIRKTFPNRFKTEENLATIDAIWKEHTDGKISANDAREKIWDFAERWNRDAARKVQNSSDEAELPQSGVRGQTTEGDGRRSGSDAAESSSTSKTRSRSLKPSGDKEPTTKGKRQAEGFLEMMRSVAGTRAGQTALGEK